MKNEHVSVHEPNIFYMKSDNNKNMAEIVTEEIKQIRPTEQLETVAQKQTEMYHLL